MEKICSSTEDEMILAFLQAEIDSEKRRPDIIKGLESIGRDENIIRKGDITNKEDNIQRRKLLDYRGFQSRNPGRGHVFERFPDDVQWELYSFTPQECGDFYYLRYPEFCAFTHGSRIIRDSISAINKNVGSPNTLRDFRGAIKSLKDGNVFSHVIGVTDRLKIVVLEGTKRITAYCFLDGQCRYQPKIILGYSSNIHNWPLF